MAAPMDLNVPLCEKHVLLQKILMAAKLGYGTIAVNNIQPDLFTKQKKGKISFIEPPESIKVDEKLLTSSKGGIKKAPRQVSRISTVVNDLNQAKVLQHEKVQQYDLVAVTPTDDKTFLKACTEMLVDIITIDLTHRLDYRLKRPPVHAAIERGIHFELQYSPALRDESLRRYFIANAQLLVFWCKGKNVIFTSGCEKAFELRGPHDVANLGLLCDLKDPQAKDAVTNNCRAVLCHSESRRSIKSVMKAEDSAKLPDVERDWILDKCSVEGKENGKCEVKDKRKCEEEESEEPQHKKVKVS